jgi:hypothetical protein
MANKKKQLFPSWLRLVFGYPASDQPQKEILRPRLRQIHRWQDHPNDIIGACLFHDWNALSRHDSTLPFPDGVLIASFSDDPGLKHKTGTVADLKALEAEGHWIVGETGFLCDLDLSSPEIPLVDLEKFRSLVRAPL